MCESSFGVIYLWKDVYSTEFTRSGNFLVLRYRDPDNDFTGYAFPFGDPDDDAALKALLLELKNEADASCFPLCIGPMVKEDMERLERIFPGKFEFTPFRDQADYIYSRDKLADLPGRKLHGKRNHISNFKKDGDWSYEAVTNENIGECLEIDKSWLEAKNSNGSAVNEAVIEEQSAVHYALKNMKELGLTGGLLRKSGRAVAFAIGEPLTDEVYCVHIEKALSSVDGAYPVINQEFVRNACAGYKYINREDDNGDEGLRRAKLSYYPEIILDKYYAVLKN